MQVVVHTQTAHCHLDGLFHPDLSFRFNLNEVPVTFAIDVKLYFTSLNKRPRT